MIHDLATVPSDGSIQTVSGRMVNVFNPTPDMINIYDIGHGLGNLCRFGGHTRCFYSVAEHSVWCSYRCEPELALYALLHDATEAYLIDMPRPIKVQPQFDLYRQIEDRLAIAVATHFGFSVDMFKTIKPIDNFMVCVEAYNLMPQNGGFVWPECPDKDMKLECWSPGYAKAMFLSRYAELTGVELCSLTR